jgi:hypothetical protein
MQRSRQLGLQRPLYHALRHVEAILGTAVPAAVTRELAQAAPPTPVAALMDALWSRALRPLHASARDAMTPAALFVLYVRAHWLRMPPLLLARHLTIKALKLHEDRPPRREGANA